MKPQSKQLALKASLLVILATNISWTAKSFNSSDLASRDPAQELGTTGGPAIPTRTSNVSVAPVLPPSSADNKPAPRPQVGTPFNDETAGKTGPKPDAPVSSVAASTTTPVIAKSGTETGLLCGHSYAVRYREVNENGAAWVYADISETYPRTSTPDRLFKSVKGKATLASLNSDSSLKTKFQSAAEEKARTAFSCESADNVQIGDQPTAPADDDKEDAAKRIARGIRECKLDKTGKALKRTDVYECSLGRLQAIDLSGDDEDQDDSKGHRSRRSSINQVESALRPLKQEIKRLLLSSNEDKQDDGADRLEDVISALGDVRDTAEGKDARAIDKMIEGLQKGFTLGAKLDRDAEKSQDRLDALDEKITDMKSVMNQAPIYQQQQQIMGQLQVLMMERTDFQQKTVGNHDYLSLQGMAQRQVLDQSDFSDFTASYKALLAQISGNNGSSAPGTLPSTTSDLLNNRQALGGSPIGAPAVNYQALGLPAPGSNVVPSFGTAPTAPFGQNQFMQPQIGQPFGQPQIGQQFPPQQIGQPFGQSGMPMMANQPMFPPRSF